MNRPTLVCTTALFAAAVAGMLAPAPAMAGEKFTLATVVPDDVFLLASDSPNVEREFLDKYWGEVYDALRETGIGADAMELISSLLGEEQVAEVERLKALATELVDGVNWDDLVGKEFAFAMRMPPAIQEAGHVTIASPDQAWLFRGADGSGSQNFTGLVAFLQAIVTEINKLAGQEVLGVLTTEEPGTQMARLAFPMPPGINYDLRIAQRGDLIIIALGNEMMPDILALCEGTSTKKPLAAEPRFQQAFSKLPPAEDGLFFFDMQQMLSDTRSLIDSGLAMAGYTGEPPAEPKGKPGVDQAVQALNAKAVQAAQGGDIAAALEFTQQAHKIAPDDTTILYNLACFHALLGHKEDGVTWLTKAADAGFADAKLMARDPDLESLRDDPSYETTLATVRENAVKEEAAEQQRGIAMAMRLVDRGANVLGLVDHVAVSEYTEGYNTHTDTICVLATDAKSKPFYPVIAERNAPADFKRFLPKETISFSINSGIDLQALYKFIEDTFRVAGPEGEELLVQWEAVQKEAGFDLRADVLDWIEGGWVTVALDAGGPMPASVLMLGVKDEAVAKEKVSAALKFIEQIAPQFTAQNPMLSMYTPRTSPCEHEKLEGFQTLHFAMQPFVWGTAEGHLILGTSADAVAMCLETAAGRHPDVTQNEQVMAEALMPKGQFTSVSFTDQRDLGKQLAQLIGMASMGGMFIPMMIPDAQIQQVVGKIVGMIAKLGPVAAKINFYKSTASFSTFDGMVSYTREVTNYMSPAERGEMP